MKKVGELGIPCFIPAIEALGDAAMGPRPKLTVDQRKVFYEEAKKDMLNPDYKFEARQYDPVLKHMLISDGLLKRESHGNRDCLLFFGGRKVFGKVSCLIENDVHIPYLVFRNCISFPSA